MELKGGEKVPELARRRALSTGAKRDIVYGCVAARFLKLLCRDRALLRGRAVPAAGGTVDEGVNT